MSHHLTREDFKSLNHKLHVLIEQGERIMTTISDFVVAQNAFNDQMDVSIAGLKDDIKGLNDVILKLQSSQGQISAEDQKSLDDLQQKGKDIADKLKELDDMTPPVVPGS